MDLGSGRVVKKKPSIYVLGGNGKLGICALGECSQREETISTFTPSHIDPPLGSRQWNNSFPDCLRSSSTTVA